MKDANSIPTGHDLLVLHAALADRYIIERELGRGGMGIVYLARDLALDRSVAIKVLRPVLAAEPELRERFLREARTAAGLSHPNVVPIHVVEEQGGLVYYVMSHIEGETLGERVRRMGPLPAGEVARVLQETAWALSYAHGRGIIHRDIKPDNILLERATGRAFVTDFGIAHVATSAPMTAAGIMLGTPQFMSPEQAAGERLDAGSDLYSLGVVGFFALTGRLPFDAPTAQAVLAMHLTQPAPPVASVRAGIPRQLTDAVDRCLVKTAAERFPSAEALVAALQAGQLATPEVAPPIRIFQRTSELGIAQLVVVSVVVVLLASVRTERVSLLLAFVWVMMLGAVLLQLGLRARSLLRHGFTFVDVQAGVRVAALEREQAAAVAASELESHRTVIPQVLLAVALIILVTGIALGTGTVVDPARKPLGVATLFVGDALLVVALILIGARNPRRALRASRLSDRLWAGWFGRALFQLAGSRLRETPALSLTRGRDVASVFAVLPTGMRRTLGDVPRLMADLEHAADARARRECQLQEALVQANAGPGTATPILADRREQLMADLQAAASNAAEERAALLAASEGLRLLLLRLRSGLGTVDDAASELQAAHQLLHRLGATGSGSGHRS